MPSYLTRAEAEDRLLSRYGIDITLGAGDVDVASDEIDASGPFIGSRKVLDGTQARAFPRSLNPDGTENTVSTVPDAVLDATALLAHHMVSGNQEAVTSRTSIVGVATSYAKPKEPLGLTRARALISPYLQRVGQRAGRSVSEREIFERY